MKHKSEDIQSEAWSEMRMGNAYKNLTHMELELQWTGFKKWNKINI